MVYAVFSSFSSSFAALFDSFSITKRRRRRTAFLLFGPKRILPGRFIIGRKKKHSEPVARLQKETVVINTENNGQIYLRKTGRRRRRRRWTLSPDGGDELRPTLIVETVASGFSKGQEKNIITYRGISGARSRHRGGNNGYGNARILTSRTPAVTQW